MNGEALTVEIKAHAADAYQHLIAERQRTLMAPEDDMWAAFADLAEPYSLTCGSELVGRFSVDEERQLHGFYVREEFEERAAEFLARVITEVGVSAAVASTVDPRFLSLSLSIGGAAHPVALMFDHVARPEIDETVGVRLAKSRDHSAALSFYEDQTGSPEAFLAPYLAERIARHELYLVEADGRIDATGECRVDHRAPGNAHLGLVVGAELRGRGLGGRLMHTLVEICKDRNLVPRCSTEPTNRAAERVIQRAGFRNRHRAFQIAMGQTGTR